MRPEYREDPVREIVGIVGDVRDQALDKPPRPAMYVPVAQVPDGVTALNVRLLPLAWIVRTSVEPQALRSSIEHVLETATEGLPVARVRSMNEVYPLDRVNEAYQRMMSGEARFRVVLTM